MIVRRYSADRILAELGDSIAVAVSHVLESGAFIGGDEVERFERECESYLGCGAAVSCASGTDAIELSLRSLGLPPCAAVATPAFTFTATASAIVAAGLRPVFVDIDPATFHVSPTSLSAAIDDGVAAVVAVSLYGMSLDDEIFDMAHAAGIPVVEDACQSFGAGVGGARNRATVTAFSFFPTKPLGCLGDGGMLTTCDMELASKARLFARHGFGHRKHFPVVPGRNSRLDAIQAAVLRAKLPFVEQWRRRREEQAERYASALSDHVVVPLASPAHAWSLYTIRCHHRDSLHAAMRSAGIDCDIFYPHGLHRTPAFRSSVELPHTDLAAAQVLSIPISATITHAEQSYVIDSILEWAAEHRAS